MPRPVSGARHPAVARTRQAQASGTNLPQSQRTTKTSAGSREKERTRQGGADQGRFGNRDVGAATAHSACPVSLCIGERPSSQGCQGRGVDVDLDAAKSVHQGVLTGRQWQLDTPGCLTRVLEDSSKPALRCSRARSVHHGLVAERVVDTGVADPGPRGGAGAHRARSASLAANRSSASDGSCDAARRTRPERRPSDRSRQ